MKEKGSHVKTGINLIINEKTGIRLMNGLKLLIPCLNVSFSRCKLSQIQKYHYH